MRLGLYFQTVRHLKFSQILGRVWFKLKRVKPDLRHAPVLRPIINPWVLCSQNPSSMLGPLSFCFLNEQHDLQSAYDWNNPAYKKLWLYNLHYFADLNAQDFPQRAQWHQDLIQRWINDNPPGLGNGWEPYPLSLRIVHWIKWSLQGGKLSALALNSLAVQIRFLAAKLETHLLGNHLLTNGKALFFAGLFFAGPEADKWLSKGIKILSKQLPEQILADGGHFERSPMYHAIILDDILDILNISRTFNRSLAYDLPAAITKMLYWLQVMSHPDGDIVLFNDAAFNIAPHRTELEQYAKRLNILNTQSNTLAQNESVLLANSGYARLNKDRAHLFVDVAPLGPDYLLAHSHADTFTFELSLDSQRIIVDSGTSTYDNNPERLCQRGTAAHNTVTIDHYNSSQVWSSFRVAKAAQVKNVNFAKASAVDTISACHNGFNHLPGKIIHKRTWNLHDSNLLICDEITGTGNHEVVMSLHFHPNIVVTRLEKNYFLLVSEKSDHPIKMELILDESLDSLIYESTYHPEFGQSVANKKLVATWRGKIPGSFSTKISW